MCCLWINKYNHLRGGDKLMFLQIRNVDGLVKQQLQQHQTEYERLV